MLKDKVTVVENGVALVGTCLIDCSSVLVGIKVFELGRLGGSSDTSMKLGFKTADEMYTILRKALLIPNSLLDSIYVEKNGTVQVHYVI